MTMPDDENIDLLEAIERETAALFTQADRLVEALATRMGLDTACFRCLCLLCRQGPMSAHRLATLAGLGERVTAQALDRLEREGHATRKREPGSHRLLVHADHAAHRARAEPALRDLREAWYSLVRHGCDDLGLLVGLVAEGRRLSSLAATLNTRPSAFTL
jgi:DNA-binding MarR family transcriptional regulator